MKPDQRLVFLFNENVIQDQIFKKDLETLNSDFAAASSPNRRVPRFEIDMKPKEVPIDLIHIQKPDLTNPSASPVYFAWYGLDNILSKNGNCVDIFNNKLWVVPSTYSYANLKAAGMIVSVDDQLVGELGSNIVLKKIDDPELDLAQLPVQQPKFRTWICRKTVRENHLDQSIRPEIFEASQRKNHPWVTFDDAK